MKIWQPVTSTLNVFAIYVYIESHVYNDIDAYVEWWANGTYKMSIIMNIQTTYPYQVFSAFTVQVYVRIGCVGHFVHSTKMHGSNHGF
jgi:hypothetical protein